MDIESIRFINKSVPTHSYVSFFFFDDDQHTLCNFIGLQLIGKKKALCQLLDFLS